MSDGRLDEISRKLGEHDARLFSVEKHVEKAVEKDGCVQRIDRTERMVRCIFLLFRYSFFYLVIASGIGFGIFYIVSQVIVATAPNAGDALAGVLDYILRMLGK